MTPNASGEPIETLFLDLSVRTAQLETEIKQAMEKAKAEFKKGGEEAANTFEKRISGMGYLVNTTLQSMISVFAQTGNPISAMTSGFFTANGAAQALAQSGSAVGASIAGILGPIGLAVTALSLLATTFQSVIRNFSDTGEMQNNLAGRVQTLQTGLDVVARNAGVFIGTVREKMEQLQATGITTRESIESLMQFLTQDLPIDNIEKLARSAQNVAVAFGKNSTETFNRFVYAIMTGNNEVLRLVGLNKTATQMQEEFAASIGKTAKELTNVERRQAIVNGIMNMTSQYAGLYEKSMESLGKRIGSLPRYIEEGTLALQQTTLPMLELSVDAAERFWKVFQSLFVTMKQVKDEAGNFKLVPDLDDQGNARLTEFGQLIHDIAKAIKDGLQPVLRGLIDSMKEIPRVVQTTQAVLEPFLALLKNLGELGVSPITKSWELLDEKMKEATGSVNWIKDAIVAADQVIKLAIAGWVGIFQILSDAVENLNKQLKGETTRSLDEILDRAAKVSNSALLGMVQPKTKVSTEPVSERDQVRAMYESITGKKSTEPEKMKPGEYGPPRPIETEEYKQWVELWRKNYEKYVDEVGKLAVERKEGIMPDTFPEWLAKQKFTDKGGDKIADEMKKVIGDMIEGGAELIKAGIEQIEKAELQFKAQMKQFEESVAKQRDELLARVKQRISDVIKSANTRADELEKERNERLVNVQAATQKRLADEDESYKADRREKTIQYYRDLARIEQQYQDNLLDAAERRDARRVLELMRDHKRTLSQKASDFSDTSRIDRERHSARIAKINQEEVEKQLEIQKWYATALGDLKRATNEKIAELQKGYQEELALLNTNARKQRDLLNQEHIRQMQELRQANQRRLAEMVASWAARNNIDAKGAQAALVVLARVYGIGGEIDQLMTAFYRRQEEMARLSKLAVLAINGQLGALPVDNPSLNPGLDESLTSYERYQSLKDRQLQFAGGFAEGGFAVANRPTNAVFGDNGAEGILSIPMNSRVSLNDFLGTVSNGNAQGGNWQVQINISSDGVISPAIEDRLFDSVARVFREVIPANTKVSRLR